MQKHIFYYTISLVAVVSYYWYVWALIRRQMIIMWGLSVYLV